MSRKKFIESLGATCANWSWSWSFINKRKKIIIFGAWDTGLMEDGSTHIFSKEWEIRRGLKQKGYGQSRDHIRLVEQEGYKLFTYPIVRANPGASDEPAKIERFETELSEAQLVKNGDNWYALPKSQPAKPRKVANPPWSRDELILALDLYFREPDARGNQFHPEVIKLSKLLNGLPIHRYIPGQTFRNPNGVGMKLRNFLSYDLNYKGKGLEKGSELEKEIWKQYSADPHRLTGIVGAIRANAGVLSANKSTYDESDDEEANEGRILTRVHKYRERDRKIVKRKKETVLSKLGKLQCEACEFDFPEVYGVRGLGFAECHHKIPVSELEPSASTRLKDLAILCANCHRMIHVHKPWLTLLQLKNLLTAQNRGRS